MASASASASEYLDPSADLPPPSSPGLEPTDGSIIPLSSSEDESASGTGDRSTKAPPPSFPSNAPGTTTYRISTSLSGRKLHIKLNDHQTFTAALHLVSKPHVIISTTGTDSHGGSGGGSGRQIGTITMHIVSRTLAATFSPTSSSSPVSVDLVHRKGFKAGYTYMSPSLNQTLTWKGSSTAILVDGNGNPIARMVMSRIGDLSWAKERTVEVLAPWNDMMGGQVAEEVLVGAVGIMEIRRRRDRVG